MLTSKSAAEPSGVLETLSFVSPLEAGNGVMCGGVLLGAISESELRIVRSTAAWVKLIAESGLAWALLKRGAGGARLEAKLAWSEKSIVDA